MNIYPDSGSLDIELSDNVYQGFPCQFLTAQPVERRTLRLSPHTGDHNRTDMPLQCEKVDRVGSRNSVKRRPCCVCKIKSVRRTSPSCSTRSWESFPKASFSHRTHTHTHTHTCVTHTHTRKHTHTHTHTHTHKHTRTNTHANTHTQTHTEGRSFWPYLVTSHAEAHIERCYRNVSPFVFQGK